MLISTKVLDGVDGQGVESFINDLVCHAPDFEAAFQRLRDLFEQLDKWDLRINGSKTTLNGADCVFLGHKVDGTGHRHLDSRISALEKMERPHSKPQLKSWLGLVNYFRSYAGAKVADILAPILQLTKKDATFKWGEMQELAFNQVKKCIVQQQKLYFLDYLKPIYLRCDASEVGCGAQLFQIVGGIEHSIAFASWSFTETEQRWSILERELYSAVWSVWHWRQHLEGAAFTILTDHL